jgi:molybdate transport system ATP-binding protein
MLTAEISKHFPNGLHVRASLQIELGSKVTVLFGPSGAGKTTVLRCIAGLEPLTEGRIVFKNRVWADVLRSIDLPPQHRSVGYLFQDYALFPHLSVRDNIAYGISDTSSVERERKVQSLAQRLQVLDLLDRRPSTLSGGEQQRVGLSRALARDPELLLLDEPLSALDGPTRDRVREELARLLKTLRLPAILVTHDWIDALRLGDRLVVMSSGVVLQTGSPQDVFAKPQHADVAAAVGMETLTAGSVLARDNGSLRLRVGTAELIAVDPGEGPSEYFVCIRGENVTLETGLPTGQSSARNHLRGIIREIAPTGALWRVTVDTGCDVVALVTRQALDDLGLTTGSEVFAVFKASAVHLIAKQVSHES